MLWSISREEVERLLRPSDYLAAVKQHSDKSTIREAFAEFPEDSRYTSAVLAHERDHLFRNLSTTYGFLYRFLFDYTFWGATQLLKEASKQNSAFLFPLLGRHEKAVYRIASMPGNAAGRELLSGNQHEAIPGLVASVLAFLSAIEWNDLRLPRQKPLVGLVPALLVVLDQNSLGCVDPSTVDLITPENGLELNARGLLESMALLETYSMGGWNNVSGEFIAEQLMLKVGHSEYTSIVSAWSVKHRNRFHGRKNIRKEDWITGAYGILPVEFYAVVDLALNPPFTPSGFQDGKMWEWNDIEPGARFWLASNWLAEVDEPCTSMSDDSREERFIEVQQKLCEVFGWPTPKELAIKWYEHFSSDAWKITPTFVAAQGYQTSSLVAHLLKKRIESPFDLVVNNLGFGIHSEIDFTGWLTREEDGLTLNSAKEEKADAMFETYLLQQSLLWMLTGKSTLPRMCKAHRTDAVGLVYHHLLEKEWNREFLIDEMSASLGLA